MRLNLFGFSIMSSKMTTMKNNISVFNVLRGNNEIIS